MSKQVPDLGVEHLLAVVYLGLKYAVSQRKKRHLIFLL